MDTDSYHNNHPDERAGPPGEALVVTDRTALRRGSHRGSHERATIEAILDAGWVCHVGFAGDHGPVVVPTAYGRAGDVLHLHGSPASRLARAGREGVAVCVTVTLVDGLVLARSAFHHSVNFRSVVIYGTATEVRDPGAKARALDLLVDHVVPGRSREARPPSERELRATAVLALPLDEASAKVATGFRGEEPGDEELAVWAGIVPLGTRVGAPQPDGATRAAGRALPPSVLALLHRG